MNIKLSKIRKTFLLTLLMSLLICTNVSAEERVCGNAGGSQECSFTSLWNDYNEVYHYWKCDVHGGTNPAWAVYEEEHDGDPCSICDWTSGFPGHTHNANGTGYNETHHWEECSEHPGYNVGAEVAHVWNSYGVCTVCKYECKHTNESGDVCSVCGRALNVPPSATPIISKQPANQTGAVGSTVTFLVQVSNPSDGGTVTYQWQQSSNGTSWVTVPYGITAGLNVQVSSTSLNNTRYRCIVTNTNGVCTPASVTSSTATLTVSTTGTEGSSGSEGSSGTSPEGTGGTGSEGSGTGSGSQTDAKKGSKDNPYKASELKVGTTIQAGEWMVIDEKALRYCFLKEETNSYKMFFSDNSAERVGYAKEDCKKNSGLELQFPKRVVVILDPGPSSSSTTDSSTSSTNEGTSSGFTSIEQSVDELEKRIKDEEALAVSTLDVEKIKLLKENKKYLPKKIYDMSKYSTLQGFIAGLNKVAKENPKEKTINVFTGKAFPFNKKIIETINSIGKDVRYFFIHNGHLYSVTIHSKVESGKVLEKSGFAGPLYIGKILGTAKRIA